MNTLMLGFLFYYPLFMSYLWMVGALYYFNHWERNSREWDINNPPELDEYLPVSILVPCYNEENHIVETCDWLLKLTYPDYEILLIDDGSSDNTKSVIKGLATVHKKVRAIVLDENHGKGMALRAGALASQNEILVCIDADAVLEPNAVHWLVRHFITGPRVGAVTGNPRIRSRSTLLGKIQVGEFSSIIGIIKRAQRIYGRIFTVSGVVAAFRKTALHRVGYWPTNTVTEDVAISWLLQINFWDIRYEPNALCWILTPEKLGGLLHQRIRWSQGGAEIFLRNIVGIITDRRRRRMLPVMLEYIISVVWAGLMCITLTLAVLGLYIPLPDWLYVPSPEIGWNGVLLGCTCLLQFAIGVIIDGRFEQGMAKYYYWIIWYPLAYWLLNMIAASIGFMHAIINLKKGRSTWTSPDRGIQQKPAPSAKT